MGTSIEIDEVILYDGKCKFCNSTVNFVIRNESTSRLKFSPLQSKLSSELSHKYKFDNSKLSTIVFVRNSKVYFKSQAIFEIASFLKVPWSLLSVFSILPTAFTDFFYDLIAKNRYKILGKSNSCILPDNALKSRFLDSI